MTDQWTADDSALYRAIAAIAVPLRQQQLATLLALIPQQPDAHFRVVELASGEGYLSAAILAAYPHAELIALDYEASMQQATAQRLAPYGNRAHTDHFDILDDTWFDKMHDAEVVVSSLCIHHLDAGGKQRLFNASYRESHPEGCLLIADLVAPQNPQATALFADTWDQFAESASIERTLQRELFKRFVEAEWNYYRYPDDFDKPSPLSSQLQWLQAAGYSSVDCFWMQAGHAIYGGYKQVQAGGIAFGDALAIAQKVLANP